MRRKTTSDKKRPNRSVRAFARSLFSSGQRTPAVVKASSKSELEGWLRLTSSGRYVQVLDACDNPIMAELACEDACWQFALQDWRTRRPPLWRHRARRSWRAEETRLNAKRDRLVETADELRAPQPR